MRRLFYILPVLVFLLRAPAMEACQCPVTSLSMDECNKYDLIFKGRIESISLKGSRSEALFSIIDLYKGNTTARFKVYFNDEDPCKLDMRSGDEWIIYTNYYQIDNAKLDFCSRSRKFFKNIREDFFYPTTNVTYDDEARFLQEKLGLHKLLKEDVNRVENRNQLPTKLQFIITLLCSLGGIILFYWLFNKFFK